MSDNALVTLILVVLFLIGMTSGWALNKEALGYKDVIDASITECEKTLPRNKSCIWKVVATPQEAAK